MHNAIPLIEYVLTRASKIIDKNSVVLATSDREIDKPLLQFARSKRYKSFAGSCDNVAQRVLNAANMFEMNKFVRVNGDSPFIDYLDIRKAIKLHENFDYDVVTNILERSYPAGMAIEVIKTSKYKRVFCSIRSAKDKEHVTSYIYNHRHLFKIKNIRSSNNDFYEYRFCVDTEDDFIFFTWLVDQLGDRWKTVNRENLYRLYKKYDHKK